MKDKKDPLFETVVPSQLTGEDKAARAQDTRYQSDGPNDGDGKEKQTPHPNVSTPGTANAVEQPSLETDDTYDVAKMVVPPAVTLAQKERDGLPPLSAGVRYDDLTPDEAQTPSLQSEGEQENDTDAPLVATPIHDDPDCTTPDASRKRPLSLWMKMVGGLFAVGFLVAMGLAIFAFAYVNRLKQDLPSTELLANYEPPVTTRVHASNGVLAAEFARERRLFVPIDAMPEIVKAAFVAAEDKNFYQHGGIDLRGVVRASLANIGNVLNKRRLEGGSTITQQVAKNFLLSAEQKIERKVREWLIARRMEAVYTKPEILELYLNEIYLGNRSYGVAAAALNYFDKSLDQLTIAEAAYLATLPKAPNNYHPIRKYDRALARRNWVIGRMLADGYISEEQAAEQRAIPLGAKIAPPLGARTSDTEYFTEAVRKEIVQRFGVKALYDEGLSIRTTLDPELQAIAQRVFRDWLVVYDQRHGWRGALARLDVSDQRSEALLPSADARVAEKPVWQDRLNTLYHELLTAKKYAKDLAPWQLAVVLNVQEDVAMIGLRDGTQGVIPITQALWARIYVDVDTVGEEVTDLHTIFEVGDVIVVEAVAPPEKPTHDSVAIADELPDLASWPESPTAILAAESIYALRQIPAVNGGFIAIDPHTGQVRAMVGGFSFGLSEFNRAIQAKRQPGSTFKPFVYAAALDNGYTPSSVVLDAPFVAPSLGTNWWKPGNYVADRFYGDSTLRLGIEKSRNTMTARLAQDIGIGLIIDYAERFGVSDELPRELAISLGAGETTLMRLTAAYSMFVNGGKEIKPIFIDRIQNRYGETVYKRDARVCVACQADMWGNQPEPRLPDEREQIIDPRTAYQLVSILQGAIQRGTGSRVRRQTDKTLAGKTGTTDDYRDAWFVGFSPDLAAGIYIGFDLPASMGQGEGGGIVAAPIFGAFMKEALAHDVSVPFRAPSGIRLVRVNAKTGQPARPNERNVILEAFKAEDSIDGRSRFFINGQSVEAGNTDEGIDDALGGLY